MKRIFILLLLLLSYVAVIAQTNGLVVNSQGAPVNQVNVYLLDQNLLLQTNNEGAFIVKNEIPNYSYIHFYKHGFASKVIRYQNDRPLKVTLEKLHVDLDEIGVSESFNILGNSKLTNIEKKSLSFLESNSMLESITELNGVDMISSGLGI